LSNHSLAQRLSTQRALLGLVQSHPNPLLTEMAGLSGYDFVFLDAEHGVLSDSDFVQACRITDLKGTLCMARVAGHDPHGVGRYLDMGADVIVVPNVSTAEQAGRLARAMLYPPQGTRSFGAAFHRSTRYGIDVVAHLQSPRAGTSLLVMIESRLGVENAASILAVEGVDGVIVGPFDLAFDMGLGMDFSQPVYAETLLRIERAAAAAGKIVGTVLHPGYPAETLLARGHRILLIAADVALMRNALKDRVEQVRACL
jgi:4-hydroxy-2-oxoheptanedioate aldolase